MLSFRTVFTKNNLPSKVLDQHSQYKLLYDRVLDYQFLRVFVFFSCTKSYNTIKLDLRSVYSVFLGQVPQKRCYVCFDPIGCKMYTFGHVMFYEDIFHMSHLSMIVRMRLSPFLVYLLLVSLCLNSL